MKSSRWYLPGAAIALAWLFLTVLPALGQSSAADAPRDGYHPGDYARVRFEENGLTIVRSETDGAREHLAAGHVNTPIFPGNEVATGPNQRAETQLANATLIRIDQHSHLVFSSLPDPHPETLDSTILRLAQGGIRLESALDEQKEFRLETPGCRIHVRADTDLRVAVRGGRTRVATLRGIARIESGGSSLVLRAGMATEVVGGATPLGARPYNSFLADDFDRWVAVRKSHSAADLGLTPAAAAIQDALPAQVQPYFRELSLHGIWVRNEHFGYAWVPHVRDPDWRPYRLGHWGYGSRGYFWISQEPWGWAPYHYGRWIWLEDLGWAWVPGSNFAGAWVAWSWSPSHVGWAALDYWNMPARRSPVEGGAFDPLSWTLVAYEHVGRRDLVDHQLRISGDAGFELLAVVRYAPGVGPRQLAEPESRSRALADAQARAETSLTHAGAGETSSVRRSFRELESAGDSRTTQAGQVTASARISTPDDVDLREAQFEPTPVNSSSIAELEEPNADTIVHGQPSAMRPLVRFEQKGIVGKPAPERWKVIYRTMAQPRPTQSQLTPAGSSTPTEVESSSPVRVESSAPSETDPVAHQGVYRKPAEKKRGERIGRTR